MKTKKDIIQYLEKNYLSSQDKEYKVLVNYIKALDENISKEDIINNCPEHIACYWAQLIGDKDIMINKITSSEWAYYWAYWIGDKNIMIDKINDPEWAFNWAYYIGDKDVMRNIVKNSNLISVWNYWFPEDKIDEDNKLMGIDQEK